MSKQTLLFNVGILTMDAGRRMYNNGAILLQGDRIERVGRSQDLLAEAGTETQCMDLRGRWILPGLINTHVHQAQQLARGIADDVDLLTWLRERIWPLEAAHDEESAYWSGLLGASMAMLVGSVSGGVIAQATNLGVPYLARAAMLGVTVVVALRFMHDLGFTPARDASPLTAVRTVIRGSIDGGFRNRPVRWLGEISPESGLIAFLIFTLTVTYLFTFLLPGESGAGKVNWWVHTLALLVFIPLIPHTKHLHLVLSPATVLLKRPSFSRIPPLAGDDDFEEVRGALWAGQPEPPIKNQAGAEAT